MKIRAFITHKKAETFTDCQDRFGVNGNTKSIAVSDGMSQSWQQKIWAQLLVEKFVEEIDWEPNNETIKPLCIQWRKRVVEFIEHIKVSEAPVNLVYRNERNLADGKSAGATFVGIRFVGIEWKGAVLGDSCLIEWNGDEATFNTSQNVDSFDNHPDYFDSNILNEGKGTPIDISGILEKDNYLFLVSDPFSDFLFEHNKQGDVAVYIQQLLKLSSHEEFESLVDEWRKIGMHNDDTTLVIVEPDDSNDFSIEQDKIDDINKLIEEEKKLIEEKRKEEEAKTEQIPTPVPGELTEEKTIENITEIEEKQVSISVEQMGLSSPNDSSNNENVKKTIVIENTQEITPDDEEVFLVEFLREYKKALQKKHSVLGNLKLKWTQKAISEAIKVMFEKYSINKK